MVYPNAIFTEEDSGKTKRIVYKANKHSKSQYSYMEVALTRLAGLYLPPNRTAPQILVKNENEEVVGLASDHMCYSARKSEGQDAEFYAINNALDESRVHDIVPAQAYDTEKIPVYFLDKLSPGFFGQLVALYNDSKQAIARGEPGILSIDMYSLTSVLATSFTLEEDDLHKGNFGFYIVKKDNLPHVVFFKIDHDLMMSDSIMSRHYGQARILHMHHGRNAFSINPIDLLEFPKLKSKNYYWPTTRQYFVNPFDPKVYSPIDIKAFINLNQDEEFNRAKWLVFYKHILIPQTLISNSLISGYPKNDPESRAQNALITNAVVARQAYLRAVLFSIPEFRDFLTKLGENEKQALIAEITSGMQEDMSKELVGNEIMQAMGKHQSLCKQSGFFVEGDTPLHVAIRLKDYRFDETFSHFRQYAKIPNQLGHTAMDLAANMLKKNGGKPVQDIRANPCLIIKHMMRNGIKETTRLQGYEHLTDFRTNNDLSEAVINATNFKRLLKGFRNIGEDSRFPLKMKKDLSIFCLHEFIKKNKHEPNLAQLLRQFKQALNGSNNTPPAPELQYIRQLRSELWIIRQIRGMLGGTSTKVALNSKIDLELKNIIKQRLKHTLYGKKACDKKEKENADLSLGKIVHPM